MKDNLKINAKEMWTLVEYLPLILWSLLPNPRDCKVFKFVLHMVDVLHCVTRKQYSEELIRAMEQTIQDHHRMYRAIFKENFTIKFHLMLHYGHTVELVGPLRHMMSFKFESKHQELKSYANSSQNRVNLPLSLCKKFCFNFALKKLANNSLPADITEVKPHEDRSLSWIPISSDFKIVAALRYRGVHFEIDDIVQTVEGFFSVRGMAVFLDIAVFYVEKLDCEFREELRSYEILNLFSGIFSEVSVNSLLSNPVNSHRMEDKHYFSIKH